MPEVNKEIRLVPLSLDHLDGIMSWVNDPEVTFYFARLGREISRAEEEAIVRRLIDSETDIIYSIFEEDEYVGQIGLSQIYWPAKNARMGAMLCRKAWGRGIVKRAAQALLARAFQQHGLHKVWLIVRADNEKGRHIWSSLGFTQEGMLRDEYFVHDQFYDMVRFGLLKTDGVIKPDQ